MAKKPNSTKTNRLATSSGAPNHPGQHVRDQVLTPRKMSVTAAAKLAGVGRPAMSNFLNGKATTTPNMASRIEHAFGLPAQDLLDLQAKFDAAQRREKGAPSNVMAYVPPFLAVKSTDIETWVTRNIPSRIRLAVLLRTLVNSTATGLKRVDFPGNNDAERPGWDGFIDAPQGSAWIPDGLSGWEFGTDQDIKRKAENDFNKAVKATKKKVRDQTTFVFVTPRNWPGKNIWIADHKAKNKWKDVRAFDSSDLEQWLEQSLAGQTWFANETLRPSQGVRTLDKCWSDWADVANPPLCAALFAPAIETAKRKLVSRLSKVPAEPTIVAADSTDEALAFLAQACGEAGGEELVRFRDRVLVFDETGTLPRLAQGTRDFIAVATNRDVERELGPLAHSMHTIVVHPRNATNSDPHVVLEPLGYEAFRSGLKEMGFERDDISKYASESGRSLTVLRRRLSSVPAVRTPSWAADHETAASLVPFLLIGTWSSNNEADQTALILLANEDKYEPLEKECQRLAGLNDAPLWSVANYRGVVSKIDLLYAVENSITGQDLKRYFELARIVLGEDDPRLDLPEGERWAASIQGKSREFSPALREGISETLVLLAVHGNNLFEARLGFNCEIEATRLVRELLTPLKARILEANHRDLTAYAEAAPDEFLSILEEDLNAAQPESLGLLRPAGTGVLGDGCPRTGLLWALEGLAWNPDTLTRAALVLSRLACVEISDNWANTPLSSLQSIFRVWMPQTAADHDTRLRVLKLIAGKYPKVAWKICIKQIDTGPRTGGYSHKPRWRNDGHGYGEPFKTTAPIHAFMREMIDMALNWKGGHTPEMLCDLIQYLHGLPEEKQTDVWNLVRSWAGTEIPDTHKTIVREKIRVMVMSRRGVKRLGNSNFAKLSAVAKAAYQTLEPADLLMKHEWLFREHWVEESVDELHDDDRDFKKRDERISSQRADALRAIYAARGLPGILELAEMGKASSLIGWLMVERVLAADDPSEFILAALPPASNSESWARKNLIHGALRALQDEKKRAQVLKKVKKRLPQADLTRVLLLAPFRGSTWLMVDKLDGAQRDLYWKNVSPDWIHDSDDENNEAVERLLLVKRPRAAFACVHYELEAIAPGILFKLMSEMVKDGNDQPGEHQLDTYYLQKALERLNKSGEPTLDQMAGLEFAYIDALARPWEHGEGYGIPNLERYVEAHPELFVQAVVWTYKRRDGGEDPEVWTVDPKDVEHFAERGYKLLNGLSRIPGHDDLGELKADLLAHWVKTVRDSCAELGRREVADVCIGELLSGASIGADGVWPCAPVRQVMEDVRSKDMVEGADTGLYNARGVTWRGEGGDQERELADKYRRWANELKFTHPFVSSELLMGMVETYEREANREDAEAGIRRRLQ